MKLLKIFNLHKYYVPNSVYIVGCGGTGAYVIANLARFLSAQKSKTRLVLMDGDTVEEKNLGRQHFVGADIGKNKAEALAERYSYAFGLEIVVIPRDIESVKDLSVYKEIKSPEFVITCVDNNATRRIVNDWFNICDGRYSKFWIDSGNEERSGQVVVGYNTFSYDNVVRIYKPNIRNGYYGINGSYISRFSATNDGIFSLPSAIEVYPELKAEGKFNSQLSCAERAISAPQNMMSNVTAATIITNYAQKILTGEKISSFCTEFSIDNVFNTKLNTEENLQKVPEGRRIA